MFSLLQQIGSFAVHRHDQIIKWLFFKTVVSMLARYKTLFDMGHAVWHELHTEPFLYYPNGPLET